MPGKKKSRESRDFHYSNAYPSKHSQDNYSDFPPSSDDYYYQHGGSGHTPTRAQLAAYDNYGFSKAGYGIPTSQPPSYDRYYKMPYSEDSSRKSRYTVTDQTSSSGGTDSSISFKRQRSLRIKIIIAVLVLLVFVAAAIGIAVYFSTRQMSDDNERAGGTTTTEPVIREPKVEVSLRVTNREYTADLADPSSNTYKIAKQEYEELMDASLSNSTSLNGTFNYSEVTGFQRGSTIVLYIIFLKIDTRPNRPKPKPQEVDFFEEIIKNPDIIANAIKEGIVKQMKENKTAIKVDVAAIVVTVTVQTKTTPGATTVPDTTTTVSQTTAPATTRTTTVSSTSEASTTTSETTTTTLSEVPTSSSEETTMSSTTSAPSTETTTAPSTQTSTTTEATTVMSSAETTTSSEATSVVTKTTTMSSEATTTSTTTDTTVASSEGTTTVSKSTEMPTTVSSQSSTTEAETSTTTTTVGVTSSSASSSKPATVEVTTTTMTTEKADNVTTMTTEKYVNVSLTTLTTEKPDNASVTTLTTEKPDNASVTIMTTEKPDNASVTTLTTEKPDNASVTTMTTEKYDNASATTMTTEKLGNVSTTQTTGQPGNASSTTFEATPASTSVSSPSDANMTTSALNVTHPYTTESSTAVVRENITTTSGTTETESPADRNVSEALFTTMLTLADSVWQDDYFNVSSAKFQEMAKSVESEIDAMMNMSDAAQVYFKSQAVGLYPGSVVVEMRIYLKDRSSLTSAPQVAIYEQLQKDNGTEMIHYYYKQGLERFKKNNVPALEFSEVHFFWKKVECPDWADVHTVMSDNCTMTYDLMMRAANAQDACGYYANTVRCVAFFLRTQQHNCSVVQIHQRMYKDNGFMSQQAGGIDLRKVCKVSSLKFSTDMDSTPLCENTDALVYIAQYVAMVTGDGSNMGGGGHSGMGTTHGHGYDTTGGGFGSGNHFNQTTGSWHVGQQSNWTTVPTHQTSNHTRWFPGTTYPYPTPTTNHSSNHTGWFPGTMYPYTTPPGNYSSNHTRWFSGTMYPYTTPPGNYSLNHTRWFPGTTYPYPTPSSNHSSNHTGWFSGTKYPYTTVPSSSSTDGRHHYPSNPCLAAMKRASHVLSVLENLGLYCESQNVSNLLMKQDLSAAPQIYQEVEQCNDYMKKLEMGPDKCFNMSDFTMQKSCIGGIMPFFSPAVLSGNEACRALEALVRCSSWVSGCSEGDSRRGIMEYLSFIVTVKDILRVSMVGANMQNMIKTFSCDLGGGGLGTTYPTYPSTSRRPDLKTEHRFSLHLRLNKTWHPEMSNPSSYTFRQTAKNITEMVDEIFGRTDIRPIYAFSVTQNLLYGNMSVRAYVWIYIYIDLNPKYHGMYTALSDGTTKYITEQFYNGFQQFPWLRPTISMINFTKPSDERPLYECPEWSTLWLTVNDTCIPSITAFKSETSKEAVCKHYGASLKCISLVAQLRSYQCDLEQVKAIAVNDTWVFTHQDKGYNPRELCYGKDIQLLADIKTPACDSPDMYMYIADYICDNYHPSTPFTQYPYHTSKYPYGSTPSSTRYWNTWKTASYQTGYWTTSKYPYGSSSSNSGYWNTGKMTSHQTGYWTTSKYPYGSSSSSSGYWNTGKTASHQTGYWTTSKYPYGSSSSSSGYWNTGKTASHQTGYWTTSKYPYGSSSSSPGYWTTAQKPSSYQTGSWMTKSSGWPSSSQPGYWTTTKPPSDYTTYTTPSYWHTTYSHSPKTYWTTPKYPSYPTHPTYYWTSKKTYPWMTTTTPYHWTSKKTYPWMTTTTPYHWTSKKTYPWMTTTTPFHWTSKKTYPWMTTTTPYYWTSKKTYPWMTTTTSMPPEEIPCSGFIYKAQCIQRTMQYLRKTCPMEKVYSVLIQYNQTLLTKEASECEEDSQKILNDDCFDKDVAANCTGDLYMLFTAYVPEDVCGYWYGRALVCIFKNMPNTKKCPLQAVDNAWRRYLSLLVNLRNTNANLGKINVPLVEKVLQCPANDSHYGKKECPSFWDLQSFSEERCFPIYASLRVRNSSTANNCTTPGVVLSDTAHTPRTLQQRCKLYRDLIQCLALSMKDEYECDSRDLHEKAQEQSPNVFALFGFYTDQCKDYVPDKYSGPKDICKSPDLYQLLMNYYCNHSTKVFAKEEMNMTYCTDFYSGVYCLKREASRMVRHKTCTEEDVVSVLMASVNSTTTNSTGDNSTMVNSTKAAYSSCLHRTVLISRRGQVVLRQQGRWASVCASGWGQEEAQVTCRQLGFRYGHAFNNSGSSYVGSVGPIQAVYSHFECVGNESSLMECSHRSNAWCSMYGQLAAVFCSNVEVKYELVPDKPGRNYGYINYMRDEGTGLVCAPYLSDDVAANLCHAAGFKNGGMAYPFSLNPPPGIERVWRSYLHCNHGSQDIESCASNWQFGPAIWANDSDGMVMGYPCDGSHGNLVKVFCFDKPVRLDSGLFNSSGIPVIMKPEDKSAPRGGYPFCRNGFDNVAAELFCKQIGFEKGGVSLSFYPFRYDYYGQKYYVNCTSQEKLFTNCTFYKGYYCSDLAVVRCSHDPKPGVNDLDTRLQIYQSGSPRRRVLVYYKGEWGTICATTWTDREANVVCKSQGYEGGIAARAYHRPYLAHLIYNVTCEGNVSRLADCRFSELDSNICRYSEGAAVLCFNKEDLAEYRLVGGPDNSSGYVIVTINNTQGLLCASQMSAMHYNILCRELGFTAGERDHAETPVPATGHVWGTSFSYTYGCGKNASNLESCREGRWYQNYGLPQADNVTASPKPYCYNGFAQAFCYRNTVKLNSGFRNKTGILQLYTEGRYKDICQEKLTQAALNTLCQQATGMPKARAMPLPPQLFVGLKNNLGVILNSSCLESGQAVETCVEKSMYCGGKFLGAQNYVAAVTCYEDALTDEITSWKIDREGRVMVKKYGTYGAVCRYGFNDTVADLFCKNQGYLGGYPATSYMYMDGLVPMWVHTVSCPVNATNFSDCIVVRATNDTQCFTRAAASVHCYRREDYINLYLVNTYFTNTTVTGRVVVDKDNRTGYLCRDWKMDDMFATALCKMMNYTNGGFVARDASMIPELDWSRPAAWSANLHCASGSSSLDVMRCLTSWERKSLITSSTGNCQPQQQKSECSKNLANVTCYRSTEKPGKCPPSYGYGIGLYQCNNDFECYKMQKCCRVGGGFGRICTEPVSDKTTPMPTPAWTTTDSSRPSCPNWENILNYVSHFCMSSLDVARYAHYNKCRHYALFLKCASFILKIKEYRCLEKDLRQIAHKYPWYFLTSQSGTTTSGYYGSGSSWIGSGSGASTWGSSGSSGDYGSGGSQWDSSGSSSFHGSSGYTSGIYGSSDYYSSGSSDYYSSGSGGYSSGSGSSDYYNSGSGGYSSGSGSSDYHGSGSGGYSSGSGSSDYHGSGSGGYSSGSGSSDYHSSGSGGYSSGSGSSDYYSSDSGGYSSGSGSSDYHGSGSGGYSSGSGSSDYYSSDSGGYSSGSGSSDYHGSGSGGYSSGSGSSDYHGYGGSSWDSSGSSSYYGSGSSSSDSGSSGSSWDYSGYHGSGGSSWDGSGSSSYPGSSQSPWGGHYGTGGSSGASLPAICENYELPSLVDMEKTEPCANPDAFLYIIEYHCQDAYMTTTPSYYGHSSSSYHGYSTGSYSASWSDSWSSYNPSSTHASQHGSSSGSYSVPWSDSWSSYNPSSTYTPGYLHGSSSGSYSASWSDSWSSYNPSSTHASQHGSSSESYSPWSDSWSSYNPSSTYTPGSQHEYSSGSYSASWSDSWSSYNPSATQSLQHGSSTGSYSAPWSDSWSSYNPSSTYTHSSQHGSSTGSYSAPWSDSWSSYNPSSTYTHSSQHGSSTGSYSAPWSDSWSSYNPSSTYTHSSQHGSSTGSYSAPWSDSWSSYNPSSTYTHSSQHGSSTGSYSAPWSDSWSSYNPSTTHSSQHGSSSGYYTSGPYYTTPQPYHAPDNACRALSKKVQCIRRKLADVGRMCQTSTVYNTIKMYNRSVLTTEFNLCNGFVKTLKKDDCFQAIIRDKSDCLQHLNNTPVYGNPCGKFNAAMQCIMQKYPCQCRRDNTGQILRQWLSAEEMMKNLSFSHGININEYSLENIFRCPYPQIKKGCPNFQEMAGMLGRSYALIARKTNLSSNASPEKVCRLFEDVLTAADLITAEYTDCTSEQLLQLFMANDGAVKAMTNFSISHCAGNVTLPHINKTEDVCQNSYLIKLLADGKEPCGYANLSTPVNASDAYKRVFDALSCYYHKADALVPPSIRCGRESIIRGLKANPQYLHPSYDKFLDANATLNYGNAVMMREGDQWAMVCANGNDWNDTDATVLCRSLGYNVGYSFKQQGEWREKNLCGYSYYNGDLFGSLEKPITNITCSGHEKSLSDCSYKRGYCTSDETAGARCYMSAPVYELVSGNGQKNGNSTHRRRRTTTTIKSPDAPYGYVKRTADGRSAFVTSRWLDEKAADLLCKAAGYHHGGRLFPFPLPDIDMGDFVWNVYLSCYDMVRTIEQCAARSGWAYESSRIVHEFSNGSYTYIQSNYYRPFKVFCYHSGVRLHNSLFNSTGIAEVRYDTHSQKYSYSKENFLGICRDGFTNFTASLFCKALGLGFQSGMVLSYQPFRFYYGHDKYFNVSCNETETEFHECHNGTMYRKDCSSGLAVVSCMPLLDTSDGAVPDMTVKLDHDNGTVLMYRNGQWGYICNDRWTDVEADKVCKNLGFELGIAKKSYTSTTFRPFLIHNVTCDGAKDFKSCGYQTVESDVCNYYAPAVVSCFNQSDVATYSLYNGKDAIPTYGWVHVKRQHTQGRLCAAVNPENFYGVLCRHLGFIDGAEYRGDLPERTTLPFWSTEYSDCDKNLEACRKRGWGKGQQKYDYTAFPNGTSVGVSRPYCFSSQKVKAFCYNKTVRVHSGYYNTSGAVQLAVNQTYRLVCALTNTYSQSAANVLCHSLTNSNTSSAIRVRRNVFMFNARPTVHVSFSCNGTETDVGQCLTVRYTDSAADCKYDEKMVALVCYEGQKPDDGIIEWKIGQQDSVLVKRFGLWGHVCSANWTNNEAAAVCRTLGYYSGVSMSANAWGLKAAQWVDTMTCPPGAANVSQCSVQLRNYTIPQGQDYTSCFARRAKCFHEADVPDIFFVDNQTLSSSHPQGRVAMRYRGTTGYFCSSTVTSPENYSTMCRLLGYPRGGEKLNLTSNPLPKTYMKSWRGHVTCGRWDRNIHPVSCIKNLELKDTYEPGFSSISYSTLSWDCGRYIPAISCFDSGDYRLVGVPNSKTQGLLVIWNNAKQDWEQVCRTGFNGTEVNSACRELGFSEGQMIAEGKKPERYYARSQLRFQCSGVVGETLSKCSTSSTYCSESEPSVWLKCGTTKT